MTQQVARIFFLTAVLIPLCCIFYCVAFIVIYKWRYDFWLMVYIDERGVYVMTAALTWALIAAALYGLWRKVVPLTHARLAWTGLIAALSMALSSLVGVVVQDVASAEVGWFMATISAPVFWMASCLFVWRETPAERKDRLIRAGPGVIYCPSCGYSLTGLKEARCPECGKQFTLDELFASQTSRAAAEIER